MLYYHNPKTNEYRIWNRKLNIVIKLLPNGNYSCKFWSGGLKVESWNTKQFQPDDSTKQFLDTKFKLIAKDIVYKAKKLERELSKLKGVVYV